ncbi:MAG: hypothetical protein H0U66_00595 [Gemmatimonadaceae bacterium]|nr:hypothetical protein [Gemmatimonadaceae bacterium]
MLRSIPVLLLLALLSAASAAQSCPAADAALGAPKSKGQLKSSYDKFADTTTLQSKGQGYAFLAQEEVMDLSLVAKSKGQTPGAMTAALHLKGTHQLDGRTQAAQTPDRFSDSSVAIVLADTARMSLRATAHKAARYQFNIIGPPSIDEDVYFPITLEQLAVLAHARDGGIRIGEFDMPMKGKLIEGADAVYRVVACAEPLATAASR